MSWLARAVLDATGATEQRLIAVDGYGWHRVAWQAFPGLDGQLRPFLFRLDSSPDGFTLLLLSRYHRPERPQWCPESCWDVKTIAPGFLRYPVYRFDTRANPTLCVVKLDASGQPKKNGRRKPITKLAEQTAWLERKAAESGFRLIDIPEVGICQDQVFRKHSDRGVHTGVRFRGVLEVTDAARFEDAFYKGIGTAKAFGFGMLLLQPIRT